MSATVIVDRVEHEETFWFHHPSGKLHAFGIVDGELEDISTCSLVTGDECDDLPINDSRERMGLCCGRCLGMVA